jgi:hypothetical protein
MARAKSAPAVDLDLDAIPEEKEPSFSFKVGGQVFRCRNRKDLHWDTVEKWLIAREGADAGSIAVAIDSFFNAVLFPEDAETFMEMKRDPAGALTVDRVEKLLLAVNEKLFGVAAAVDPTPPPAPSARGSRANGTTSKAVHDGRVTRTA